MRISFNTFACPDWPLERIVNVAERIGYQGVEFRCDAGQLHGVDTASDAAQRKRVIQLLDKAGLEACCLATSLQCSSDLIWDQAPALLDLAAGIKCPAIRVFCGPLPEGRSIEELIDKAGRQLRVIAEMADPLGIQLWLETHDSACTAKVASGIFQRARHTGVGYVYDNLHPYRRGEAIDETMALIGSQIRHVHFHDGFNEPEQVVIRPFGQGAMPLEEMFQALINTGYDGYISGEWFNTMYGEDAEEALEAYYNDMTSLASRFGVRLGEQRV